MKQAITNFQSSYWQSQYNKALCRLERAVGAGRFAQFTQRKKAQLPNRLSRYARHLGLAMKPTLIAAGIAAGLTLATPSTAQTFTEQTGATNPLNGVDVGFRAAPTFVDIDNDGDKDAFIGESTGTILYYKNTGTAAAPVLTVQTGAANPFNGVDVGFNSAPTFEDIDNDGDKDAFIGENDGTINYYKNTGTAAAPVFAAQTGAANPFNGVDVGTFSTPIFVDIDNDGDKDAFIGEINGTILYYKNTGTAAAPVFTVQTNAANPFNGVVAFYSAPNFVDIDNDGDKDAFIGEQSGTILYYKNTGTAAAPVFAAQTGAANPFNGVDVGTFSAPTFEDIDNDGDKDAFIGEQGGTIKYYKNAPVVVPVELIHFAGKGTEGGNLLTWTTANEVNNKGFQVERLNGNDWQNIGFKTAPSTRGKASNYQFTDNTPLSISSYRLRQIDFDGTETLSKIITIQNKGTKGKLAVYPNPVANVLTVELDSPLWGLGAGNFQILNLLGQQVLTGKTAQRIDVSALPQGSYFLKVGAEQVKFVKQ